MSRQSIPPLCSAAASLGGGGPAAAAGTRSDENRRQMRYYTSMKAFLKRHNFKGWALQGMGKPVEKCSCCRRPPVKLLMEMCAVNAHELESC